MHYWPESAAEWADRQESYEMRDSWQHSSPVFWGPVRPTRPIIYPSNVPEVLTSPQVAAVLGLDLGTVKAICARGELRCDRGRDMKARVRARDVLMYANDHGITPQWRHVLPAR